MRHRSLILVVLLALVIAACGGGEDTPTTTTPPGTATSTTAGPEATTTQPEATTTTTPEPRATVDITEMVEAVREANGVPAMAGAVVTKDEIRAIGVSGVRRQGTDVAVTLDDKWHLGSMLKSITSLLAGIAVDEGLLSWDTTIGEAYPDLTVAEHWTDVTLSDLLAMRSGMAYWPESMTGGSAREQRENSVRAALRSAPDVEFGTYLYSNWSYVVAGSMIERAMGGNYEDLIVERIGNPLGATGIGWGPQNTTGQNDQPVPHVLRGNSWAPQDNWDNPPGLSAAGRAHMPLGSWLLIIQEFLRTADGEGTLVSPETGRYLFTGITPVARGEDYAMGWNMTNRHWDIDVANHSGTNLANFAVAWLGLQRGYAYVGVMNAGFDDATDNGIVDELITELISWHQHNR